VIPKRHKQVCVVLRKDQDKKLDREARSVGKTRSAVLRDLLERHFTVVPDALSDPQESSTSED